MKTLSISKGAWHYRMIRMIYDCMPQDICAYIRAFIWSACFLTAITIILTFVAIVAMFGNGGFLAWLIWMVVNMELVGWKDFELLGLITWLFLIGGAVNYAWQEKRIQIPRNEFLSAAHESVHDKICFRVCYTSKEQAKG